MTNLPLLVVSWIATEVAAWLLGKPSAALIGGALMAMVSGQYIWVNFKTARAIASLRSALANRQFRDSLVFLLFIIPGPLLGWAIALIT